MLIRQFFKRFSINNIQNSTHVFLCLVLCFISSQHLSSQIIVPTETVELAESSILNLKDHYLVVRLQTKKNALDKLDELASKSNKPNGAYSKKAQMIREDRDWENTNMIKSIKEHYTFSKVIFIPEDKYEDFLNGQSNKIAMNEKLELVDLEEMPSSYILLARVVGHHYDWISMTEDGIALNDPFPSYFRLNNGWEQFIKGVFKPKAKNSPAKYDSLAKKISEKMQKYYTNVTY